MQSTPIVWLSTTTTASLLRVSDRAVRIAIKRGKYQYRYTEGNGIGRGGKLIEIALSSLPQSAQIAYIEQMEKPAEKPPEVVEDRHYHELRPWQLKDAQAKEAMIREWNALYHQTPSGQRTQIGEQFAAQHGVSTATLYRLWRRWKKHPIQRVTALAHRGNKNRGRRLSITEDMAAFIVAKFCRQEQPPLWHVYEDLCDYCDNTGHKIPGHTTVRTFVKSLPPAVVCFYRVGPHGYKQKYGYYTQRELNNLPVNGMWVSDHRQFDVMVIDDTTGDIVRPWITAHMDIRSRYFVGYHISLQPNSRTIALAMYNALTCLADDNPNGLVKGFKPQVLYMDDGKDYRSAFLHGKTWQWHDLGNCSMDEEMRGFLPQLGIDPKHALPYSPQSKPIEPAFRNMAWRLERYLPGWCGNSPANKPEKLDAEIKGQKLLLLSEFTVKVAEFFDEYHHKEHSALGCSPFDVFTAGAQAVEMQKQALMYLMMNSKPLTVYRNGVRPLGQGINFWHDKLGIYVDKKVICRWDPKNISEVHVFTPQNEYICTANNIPLAMMGETSEPEFKAAAKRIKGSLQTVKDFHEAITSPLDITENIRVERKRKAAHQEEAKMAVGAEFVRFIGEGDAMANSAKEAQKPKQKYPSIYPQMSLSEINARLDEFAQEQKENTNDSATEY